MGNVFVTGSFHEAVDFGGGPLTSAGDSDLFVAKLNAAGDYVWAKRFGDAAYQAGLVMAVDGAGNVLMTGQFGGAVDFGGGPITTAGSHGLYVAKLDASGDHVWSKPVGDSGIATGIPANTITVAAGSTEEVVFTGSFDETADFGGASLVSAGGQDLFAAKLDATGRHVFSRREGDGSNQTGLAVAVDGAGNMLLTGRFDGAVDFGGGPLASVGSLDIFLVKLNTNGGLLWSKRFGDTADQHGIGVATDKAGNVLLTGMFSGTVDFGNGPLVSAGGSDIFVAKFSP